jgi:predicted permease
MMETIWQDLKYGARVLARNPGFALIVVFTLAIGIAANTTIFSVFNALLLKPMPGRDPARLATVYTSDYSGPLYGASSYADFVDFRERSRSFTSLTAHTLQPLLLTEKGESQRIMSGVVTANYFDTLGVGAAYGRTFLAEEDNEANAGVVVLSYGLWQRQFGSDPTVVGRTVRLNGKPFTIVGTAPASFNGLLRGLATDVWVPMAMLPRLSNEADTLTNRGSRGLMIVGRLKAGGTVSDAQAEMAVVADQLHKNYGDYWTNVRREPRRVTVLSESRSRIPPSAREPVLIFMTLLTVVVGLVLLVACANVASLLLARAAGRRREIAVRVALGAGRGRLVRQLLVESVFLALLAGAVGIILALWTTGLMQAFQPPLPFTLALELEMDNRVLGYTLGLSILTGILFGLAPALRASRPDLVDWLKEEGAGSAGGYRRSLLRNALVVAQVAVSMLLLVGSGLLLRSLANAEAINPGFNPENVLVFSVDLDIQGYAAVQGREFYRNLRERLEKLPRVEAVSMARNLPLGLGGGRRGISIQDYEPGPGEDMEVHFDVVAPGYFEALQIPMVRGRTFTKADAEGAPGAVIVNEAFARRYWPGQDPLGKRMSRGRITQDGQKIFPLEVVGVAKDGKYVSLGEDPRPYVYYCHLQQYEPSMSVLVRTASEPKQLIGAVRGATQSVDPNLPIFSVTTLVEHLGISLIPVRIAATLLGIVGLVAMILASLGVYGMVSYAVSQRTQEIGIRIALGARANDILRLAVGQGAGLVFLGITVGLAAAFGVTRFMKFLLYGISPTDPMTFVGIAALLAGVALLACYFPARRATRVDPMVALRYE